MNNPNLDEKVAGKVSLIFCFILFVYFAEPRTPMASSRSRLRRSSCAASQDSKGDRSAAQFCEDNLDRNSSY